MENNKSEFLKNPIEKKQIILKDIWSEILNKPDIGTVSYTHLFGSYNF